MSCADVNKTPFPGLLIYSVYQALDKSIWESGLAHAFLCYKDVLDEKHVVHASWSQLGCQARCAFARASTYYSAVELR